MRDLGEIKTHIFNNRIIISIDSRWTDYFNSTNPTFKAVIENGKYILVGPKVNHSGPTSNPTANEVDTSG